MNISASINTVPQEILEHIAYFAATETFLGPPSALTPLLLINRKIHSRISTATNHHLYARIFAYKFDVVPAIRRLGIDRTNPSVLATELQRRYLLLKRIRTRSDAIVRPYSVSPENDQGALNELLFNTYLLMLENEGKNEHQLRDYGRVDDWLTDYWFNEAGASLAIRSIHMELWPPKNEETSLAMWLFWFLLRPEDYTKENEGSWIALNVLKVYALAAHKYNLTSPSWVDFVPISYSKRAKCVVHYSATYQLRPPPLATPAILSFLTLVNQMSDGVGYSMPLTPASCPVASKQTHEWECEWGRCISLGHADYDRILTESFRPGSIEGVWEGLFTYTEFTAYAALLSGAAPGTLQKSMVVRHRQTWKLREHHLLAPDPSRSDSGIDLEGDNVDPLSAGDPLRSYFPTGTLIKEHRYGIEVHEPGSNEVLNYQRASLVAQQSHDGSYVQDIIITGEGHSAWGQFNLVGRVRPCDGFVSLSKEYVDGDRGKWLYRGYLVGNVNGNLAGRWRDTLSPADVPGYEGCFTMSRRR